MGTLAVISAGQLEDESIDSPHSPIAGEMSSEGGTSSISPVDK